MADAPHRDQSDAQAMTDQQRAEAKQYGRRELYCSLADKALDLVYLAAVALWAAKPLDAALAELPWLGPNGSLRLLALFAVVTLGHMVVSFPLSFYAGHVLEHRFGLSRQSLARWLGRYAKRNLLALVFGAALVLGLFWLIWTTANYWWLVAAGAFFVVSVLMGQLAPVLILPLFYKIEKLQAPELAERIRRLAEGTGLSIEGVYRIGLSAETSKANAMLAGLGRTRRVLLADTLLEGFEPDEIEVIFAHEIGHHVHRHIHKLIAAGLIFSVGGFYVCHGVLSVWAGGQVDYAELPVSTLPAIMLILTVFGLVFEPLQNAISRHFERQSDRYALERTALADAYRSAFHKLSRLNKSDPDPHWLEVALFHSHPPIAERLALADSGAEMGSRAME